jgi:hypothetical protein
MASITFFAWLAVGLGMVIAFILGHYGAQTPDTWSSVGAGIADVLLGIGLCFATGITHSICSGVFHYCTPTEDTTVWSVAYPLIAIPAFWIATAVGASDAAPSRESK